MADRKNAVKTRIAACVEKHKRINLRNYPDKFVAAKPEAGLVTGLDLVMLVPQFWPSRNFFVPAAIP